MTATSATPTPDRPDSRVVRVFISSTFRDFAEERDLLVKRVFPELRRRARERFVEIIGVDLRWGITEEQANDGQTLPLCLREIDRARPYFIGLLGERYGWTPGSDLYPDDLLARQPWLKEHAGGTSVTELEILHGVLNNPEMAGRATFYLRDPAWSAERGEDFRSEGEQDQAKLARLKARLRESPFPTLDYETPEQLADRVLEDLWATIDAEYPADDVPDELERERRGHEAYAEVRRRVYIGQEETIAALIGRLESASDEPGEEGSNSRITLVTGESGTGKSALLANVLHAYRRSHPDDIVLEHYIGSTPDASDPHKLMTRIAEEIRRLTESFTEIATDPEELEMQFASWLAEASAWAKREGRHVVLALDALDKLSDGERMHWLPRMVLPHLRIVVSTLPGDAAEALEPRELENLAATPFSRLTAERYIRATLARVGRALPDAEVARILAHPRVTLPIFLKTLVDELSVFGSHEELPDRLDECLATEEPDDLFEVILARLEEDLGASLVRSILEAIWASPEGMTDEELIAFAKVNPRLLSIVKLSLDDAIHAPAGMNAVAHDFLHKAIEDRYVVDEEASRLVHFRLGTWWSKQSPTDRSANETDFHLYLAEAWTDLQTYLSNPETGLNGVRHIPDAVLYSSWAAISEFRDDPTPTACIATSLEDAWPEWKSYIESTDSPAARLQLGGLRSFLDHGVGESPLALSVANYSLARARSTVESSDDPDDARELAICLACVGDLERDRGNLEAASKCLDDALGLNRRIAEASSMPDDQARVAMACFSLGKILVDLGDHESSRRLFDEALEIRRSIAAESPTRGHRRELAVSIDSTGVFFQESGDLPSAKAAFDEASAIMRSIADETAMPENMEDLAFSLNRIGMVHVEREDPASAVSCLSESLDLRMEIAEDSKTPNSQRSLAIALDALAQAEMARLEIDSARSRLETALSVMRERRDQLENLSSHRDLAVALIRMSQLETKTGNHATATSLLEDALDIDRWVHANVQSRETASMITIALGNLSDTLRDQDEWDRALEYKTEELQIDLELGDPVDIRKTYASAIELADAAGNADQADTWRKELAEFERTQDAADGNEQG